MTTEMPTPQAIPATVQTEALDLLKQSFALLSPYLQALTPADRRALLKVSDGSEAFVSKGVEYVGSNPEFVPPYMNSKALTTDVANFAALNAFKNQLIEYYSLVSDTRMAAGNGAFTQLLSYYSNVKLAAGRRVPAAKNIYEDMKKRFQKKKLKKAHFMAEEMNVGELNKVA